MTHRNGTDSTEETPPDAKARAARKLVEYHFVVEGDALISAYLCRRHDGERPTDPIKLIEVHENAVAVDELWPITFSPTRDLPYVVAMLEVPPLIFAEVEAGTIRLPEGWEEKERIERAAA